MKKTLTLMAAGAFLAGAANAQRFSVYEEFSGENCPPCALYNPGLWTLMQANTSKVMLLKYQVPIPSAGPIYNANMTDANARDAYYAISSAPSGTMNGGATANIANLTQAQIDAAYNVAPAFSMSVTHSYSSDYDSVFATINITALTAFTGTTMKLRTGYVATMEYPTAPGTNGEKEFHNVVQKMYPSAAGTTIPNTWTAGQTQSYTVSGPIQSFVDRSNHTFVAAWIQDDATKAVALGAKSAFVPMNLDASITAVTSPSLTCATGTSANLATSLTLVNNGTTPLTTAKIYYRSGTGSYSTHTWNGTLAPNASTTVTLPASSVPAGSALLVDSVAMPNNVSDLNPANNRWTGRAAVYNNTVNSLPISTGFESAGATPTGWLMYDGNGNSNNWVVTRVNNANSGHNNSTYFMYHDNFTYAAGETNYAIAPTPNVSASNDSIEFWVAYAQYQAEQDRLDVVYSTNCGQTWTSFWNKAGSALATAPATQNGFIPAGAADWRKEVVALNTVPAGAMIAFKATSDYGNRVFVDDITLRVGAATSVAEVVAGAAVQLSPNPARESATLEFTLGVSNNVRVDVVDMAGRMVQAGADMKLAAGAQKVTINTATLPAGLYMVRLQTEQGAINERLTVIK